MPRGYTGSCQVCVHKERAHIEFALAGGATRRALAKMHDISDNAIRHHFAEHLTTAQREQLAHFAKLQQAPAAPRPSRVSHGLLTWYRQQAGLESDKSQPTHCYMRVPADFAATFYGTDGTRYTLAPGQVAKVRVEDRPQLARLGAVEIHNIEELRA